MGVKNEIKKILVYKDLKESDKIIVNKLIENNILLKVDIKRAEQLGFKD